MVGGREGYRSSGAKNSSTSAQTYEGGEGKIEEVRIVKIEKCHEGDNLFMEGRG